LETIEVVVLVDLAKLEFVGVVPPMKDWLMFAHSRNYGLQILNKKS
jgi:hypothetical protein